MDFHQSAQLLGVGIHTFKLLIVLFLNYPISFLFRLLPHNARLKHTVGIGIGIFEFLFCFGPAAGIHAFLTSTITLLLIIYARSFDWTPKINFIWTFAYLCCGMWNSAPEDLDWTASQMVLTIKLTSVAFNYYDGTRPAEERKKELTPEQQTAALETLPSFLEWYGYVFFYAGFLAGPSFTMKEYLGYIHMTQFKDCNGQIPPSFVPTMKKLVDSLFCLVIYLVGTHYLPASILDDLSVYPFYVRVLMVAVVPLPFRVRYYFVWLLTEGAFIANGFGYSGIDEKGNAQWNRMCNIKPLAVEFAQNVHGTVNNWNITTHNWLKNYVYLRITPISRKPNFFSVYGTYFVSALWHGFHAGFYLFFLSSAFATWLSRDFRAKVRPHFLTPEGKPLQPWKFFYDIAGFIICQYLKGYLSAAFVVLSLDKSLRMWAQVNFFGHRVLIAGFLFIPVFSFLMPKRPLTSR